MPILLREWSVWLPPGYEIADTAGGAAPEIQPTWSQRLFGPLGRSARGHVFNPLLSSDWREILGARSQSEASEQEGQQSIRGLGMILADYLNDEALTWGQLLSLLSESEAALGRVVLVDGEGLADIGVTPWTPVGRSSAELPLERGAALLKSANLAAIAAPGTLLFTSARNIATHRGQLADGPLPFVRAARPGTLADELRAAAQGEAGSRFESVELWRAGTVGEAPLWLWPERAPLSAGDPRGWTNYTLACSETAAPRVRIVRVAAMHSLAWAVFLALVAAGLWKPLGKPWMLVALIGASAGAALVVPRQAQRLPDLLSLESSDGIPQRARRPMVYSPGPAVLRASAVARR